MTGGRQGNSGGLIHWFSKRGSIWEEKIDGEREKAEEWAKQEVKNEIKTEKKKERWRKEESSIEEKNRDGRG